MIEHLPLALSITVVAASVLVGLMVALVYRRSVAVVVTLAAWLGLDIVLGALGEFAARANDYVPLIVPGIAVPLVVGIVLLRRLPPVPRSRLIGVQVYRVVGVLFVVAWLLGKLPAAFALPAGVGDVLVGLAAPLVAARSDRSPAALRWWIAAGITDLVLAVALGFLTSPSPLQQLALGHPNTLVSRLPFVLIPTFAVPLSVLLHLVAWRRTTTATAPAGGRRRHVELVPGPQSFVPAAHAS